MKPIVFYHGNCYDGFGAAFSAWKKFGSNAVYHPCVYGTPIADVPQGSRVFMIDFSLPREEMLALKEKCDTLIVLDHHKTAEENLKGLDFAIFDMNKSGAMLAWEYFHPGTEVPPLIKYIQDRDLWRHELTFSAEVHAALSSYPMDFDTWDKLNVIDLIEGGKTLLRYRDVLIKMICDKSGMMEIQGYPCMVVNSTSHWSEVGNHLANKNPTEFKFGASFYVDSDGSQKWSLRSIGDFDVSSIARCYGGGGHKNAAGFVLPKGKGL
jgi:uncharacterized protein